MRVRHSISSIHWVLHSDIAVLEPDISSKLLQDINLPGHYDNVFPYNRAIVMSCSEYSLSFFQRRPLELESTKRGTLML